MYSTTRKQAVVEFVSSLQMDDGLFVDQLDSYYSERSVVTASYAVVLLSSINSLSTINLENLVEYVIASQMPDGSFGFLANTIANIRLLYACNHVDDLRKSDAIAWIYKLQCDDGGFMNQPPAGAESVLLWDTAYAVEALSLLGVSSFPNHTKIVTKVLNCRNSDGGFSLSTGEQSSIIGTFYAIKILSIINELHRIDVDNVTEFVKTGYDPVTELFMPQNLAGIYHPYLILSYLGNLGSINMSSALDFILSLQSPLHGAFVYDPEYVNTREEEKIRTSHDLIELLLHLNGETRLNEEFEVQEEPVWNELTITPPPIPPEVILILIISSFFVIVFSVSFLLYSKKLRAKKIRKKSKINN